MTIAIGNDHTALQLKAVLAAHLQSKGHTLLDVGTNDTGSADYPVYGEYVGQAVAEGRAHCGIVLCGTGAGIAMAAGKVRGIRAATASEPYTARLTKQHNNTNVLGLGARVVAPEYAKMIVDAWLEAEFLGERHQRRVDMIMEIEQRNGE